MLESNKTIGERHIGLTIKDVKEGVYTVEQMEAGFDRDKPKFQEWKKSNVQFKFTQKNAITTMSVQVVLLTGSATVR